VPPHYLSSTRRWLRIAKDKNRMFNVWSREMYSSHFSGSISSEDNYTLDIFFRIGQANRSFSLGDSERCLPTDIGNIFHLITLPSSDIIDRAFSLNNLAVKRF
jgi:hypothetical protein